MIYLGQDPIGISNIPESYPELVQNVAALNEEIISKAPVVYREASGEIVTISDGADAMPLKECTVQIDPVQDLHGYDNPWPAGGGKNLFDPEANPNTWIGADGALTSATGAKTSQKIVTDGVVKTFVVSNGDNQTSILCITGYNASDEVVTRTAQNGVRYLVFTTTADMAYVRAANYTDHPTQLEENSSATDFAPFSNICPITGHTETTVTRTGGNLLPTFDSAPTISGLTISVNDGKITINGTIASTTTIQAPVGDFVWDGVQDAWLSGCPSGGNYSSGYSLRVDGPNAASYSAPDVGNGVQLSNYASDTIISGKSIRFTIVLRAGTYTNLTFAPMLNFGNSALPYEEYRGMQTYSVTLPTEAGTVYGGTVDLKAKTLTVDSANVDLGTLQWTYNGTIFSAAVDGGIIVPTTTADRDKGIISSIYPVSTNLSISASMDDDSMLTGSGNLYIRDTTYTTVADFKSALSGAQLVYKLAEPLVYSLTDLPTITTLPGYNAIWSDTGAISVTYPADTKTYVDDHTPVQDVQINGTSILSNGVANVPVATASESGVVQAANWNGLEMNGTSLRIFRALESDIKTGTNAYRPITPSLQQNSVFYALAKLAGVDMASSSNPVGTYTDAAKIAIQKMLGIYEPPFELIRNITLSERTSVDISVDDNGLPFSLRSIYVEILYAANLTTETSGYGRYSFYDSSDHLVQCELSRYTTGSNVGYKTIYIERIGTMAIAHFTKQAPVGDSSAWRVKSLSAYGACFNIGNIVRIAMPSGDYEPAGTRIKVYAQRAY